MFYPHDISLMSIFSILPQPPTHVSQASAVFSLQRTASSSKAWSNSAMRFLSVAICGDGKSFQAIFWDRNDRNGLPKWTLSKIIGLDDLPYGCVSKLWRHREGKKHASSDTDSHMEIYGNLMEFGGYNPLHPQILVGYVTCKTVKIAAIHPRPQAIL